MEEKSSITKHLELRAEQRFDLKLNRKARVELAKLVKEKGNIIQWQDKMGNPVSSDAAENKRRRKVVIIPLFESLVIRKLNPGIKETDTLIVVYDRNVNKILTVLPEYSFNYKSTYKIGESKW